MADDNIVNGEIDEDNQVKSGVDIAAGIVLAAISIFALVWLFPNYIVPATGENDIGPEFFPKLAAWAVLGLSILLVTSQIMRFNRSDTGIAGRTILFEIAAWMAISVVTLLGILKIGLFIISPLIIILGAVLCGYRKWWIIVVLAVIFPVVLEQAAWLVFTVDLP